MNDIKVFASEKRDGISELISNNIITFASDITTLTTEPEPNNIFQAFAANKDQPDLIHRYSILVSVGWNANDDVFHRDELWNARATPVDKQVNFMHDELTIIGHMTESFVLDENRNLLKTESEQELPEKFDIGVGFVLYKVWQDKERAELVSKVIAEIDSGSWFVSMECLFPSFDYAVIDKNNNHKTIARTEQTAFLSKYLRSYGGSGTYQDYKIGRLLRGLFFSGKGIVENPANKRSLILNNNITFSSTGNLKIREVKMEELDKVKAELASALAEQKRLTIELAEKAKAQVSEQVDSLTKTLESTKAEVTSQKTKLEEANSNLSKALAEAKAAKEDCEKMDKEVAKMKLEAIKAARISQLIKVGLVEAKATEVYTKWASVADEQFADIVALHKVKADDMDDDDDDVAKANLEKAEKEKTIANTKTEETDNKAAFIGLSTRLAQLMPRAAASLATQTNK